MRENRVINLPVFRTMFMPVARKEWKCNICKMPVEKNKRYVHYIDRRPHEIIRYRFHIECFSMVEAYCKEKNKTSFTPRTVQNWAKKTFCENCNEDCSIHNCKRIEGAVKMILRNHRNAKINS